MVLHRYPDQAAPPSPDGWGEPLFRSERTLVYRLQRPHAAESIILKVPLGPSARERLRHEEAILRRLDRVSNVSRLAATPPPANALALEDQGGVALAHLLAGQRLDIPRLLKLARQLADIVAALHGAGVAHRDINPDNILLAGDGLSPILIDFDHATTLAEERPPFVHHREIAGNLPYLAPEQTGRVGRPLDQRADLYGLGATLYELATGAPPFCDPDPLELIRQILTQAPPAPVEREPALPLQLSRIIMRLLEKEPDRRYQSAEGLAHDLSRLLDTDGDQEFDLGERDFPLRLSPPSRLFGREREIQALHSALERACTGQGASVLVSGAPGIGKTALINELRQMATARRGLFVSGKFDQYRRDQASGGVTQALRALGRLLLAEDEDELRRCRRRILEGVGSNTGLITAALPEFATLLGVAPTAMSGDPREAQVRLHQAGLELLRAVASPDHPLVMVVDDLQWADQGAIDFINTLLTAGELNSFLLVCAYRETEVDPLHPLSARLTEWERLSAAPLPLRLGNLRQPDLSLLVADMLRLRAAAAAELARAVTTRTQGNPYDTMELLNALRADGVLRLGRDGWRWDEAAIRRHVGRGDVTGLVAARIAGMPHGTRELLEVMACLGSESSSGLLAAATGLGVIALEEAIRPALEDGLLVLELGESIGVDDGNSVVRFRHDRVQQAAHDGLEPSRRSRLQLTLGRRLARLPEFGSLAAEQYLAALEMIEAPEERSFVAGLFRGAAGDARVRANYTATERFLAEAMALLISLGMRGDDPACIAMATEWHGALYCLARLEQADSVYSSLERHVGDPLELVEAACIQINSLSNRNRQREAVSLGLKLLRRLGIPLPRDYAGEVERELEALYCWIKDHDVAGEIQRPEVRDARVVAIARLLHRMMGPAFFYDPQINSWIILLVMRLWIEHGPSPSLLSGFAGIPVVTAALRNDFQTGYLVARMGVQIGEALGYEPETSWVRHCFNLFSAHWRAPLERSVEQSHLAHQGLLRGGDLQYACFTFYPSLAALLECGETLASLAAELEQALAFARRTANVFALSAFLTYQQLMRALQGVAATPGGFSDHSYDEEAVCATLDDNPVAAAWFHILRALSAALFNDAEALARHGAQAMPLLPHIQGFYPVALAHLLQALACAERLRTAATAEERGGVLAELDVCGEWLRLRAEQAPANFSHLLRLVEAERAWATGDNWSAARSFDAAMTEAGERQRPWHRALVTERAARFHLAQGLEQTGRTLFNQARELYRAWGATGKVRQLDNEGMALSPPVEEPPGPRDSGSSLSNDSIDLMAMMRASRALSSETSLVGLHGRVVALLEAMTGATAVRLLIRRDNGEGWHLMEAAEAGTVGIPLEDASQGLLPLSVVRYVERTLEPLLLDDATQDDRFSHDPYLARLQRCSLLAIPILSQGTPRALLLLENNRGRSAFSTDRLDAVMLLGGQLAVSLDNALLYDSLERKVAERTSALESEIVARRSAEELYRTLVEHSPDGILLVDPHDGTIVRFNSQAHLQLGYSRDEFSRFTIAELGKTDAEHLEKLAEQGEVLFDTSHYTREGELRTIQARFKAIRYGGQAVAHCVYRDVTASRKMEQELLKARNLESLALLSGGIAHDFNNLLTSIMGNISLAQMLAPDDDKLFKLLSQAEKASLRAAILTRQLLTFARGGAPVKQITALGGVIRECVTSSLTGTRVTCSFTLPDDLWPCQVDVGQISQVINNLVINADQAMPEGGIISISAENLMLAPGSPLPLEPGPYLKIDVRDQGEGISPDLISSVFDPYFTTRQERVGLGLATTYSIMKRHGGVITVESEPAQGTLFTLYLPAMAGMNPEKGSP